jgi:hypothetical protein
MPASKAKPGSGPTGSPGPGLNELTIRRQGSRALSSAQEQAYLLLCACADRLRNHDLAAVDVMHAQACTVDTLHDGVPVGGHGGIRPGPDHQFGTRRAEVSPKAVLRWEVPTSTLADAAVVGGVMVASMIQDTLQMAGMGPLTHR